LLSSSLMLQSVILRSTLLVASVKSMLLLSIRFPKVLGSFKIFSCLLIIYSSSYFPLLFLVVPCHDVDLALLSTAIKTHSIIPCSSTLPKFGQVWFDGFLSVPVHAR